jgi:hypothetical protein
MTLQNGVHTRSSGEIAMNKMKEFQISSRLIQDLNIYNF